VNETLAQRTGVCGCCEGMAESTPVAVENLPGLSALAYRVGTHATFMETMLVGLSREPALRGLTTRATDDPTIALVDVWAAVLDVLTFYQERIANEGYLATALEQRSIRELARAIGYELGPGVAAETRLVFQLETAPGAPESATLPVGTKVQSVPGQNEHPQTFETVEEIEARTEWNALRGKLLEPTRPAAGAVELYVKGSDTGIRPGDLLAFAGKGWTADPAIADFVLRHVVTVEPDADRDVTRLAWSGDLDFPEEYALGRGGSDVAAFVFRRRAPLFGHNAPDWHAMPKEVQDAYKTAAGIDVNQVMDDWPGLTLKKVGAGKAENGNHSIFLDAVYPEIVGGCAALTAPGFGWLFSITQVAEDARTDFTMSAKTTKLELDPRVFPETPADGFTFDPYLRTTTVFANSEELTLAEWPVQHPVWGTQIDLASPVSALPEGRHVIVSGLQAYITPGPDPPFFGWWLDPGDGSYWLPAFEGEVFRVVSVGPGWGEWLRWRLDDGKGKAGTLLAKPDSIVAVEPPDDAELLTEAAVAAAPAPGVDLLDTLVLSKALEHVYHRPSVRIAANVARATHGEGRVEILGGGDASIPFQRFALKDRPLTYVQSATTTGASTTLSVRVAGVLWREVRSLYGRGPRDRVYTVRIDDEGTATVEFGDGATGARLPTGGQNLRAAYRVWTGLAGDLGAGRLTMLLGAPLGVKGVTNPLAATGGDDPETGDRARRSAPLTVRTFERIVSLDDVEDFAAAFAGVGKARATRLWDGEAEIVHLTIAGADGKPPKADDPLLTNLRQAVASSGDPHLRMQIDPFVALPFAVEATVFVQPDHESDEVLTAVRTTLLDRFSFENCELAASVALSEVVSTAQGADGVVGVDLLGLHLVGEYAYPNDLLVAKPARFSGGTILPAQLLTPASENLTVTAA
jgi:hypothetical protein